VTRFDMPKGPEELVQGKCPIDDGHNLTGFDPVFQHD
jgi:hypothetical protein